VLTDVAERLPDQSEQGDLLRIAELVEVAAQLQRRAGASYDVVRSPVRL
jgi:hypothetical protein